MQGIVVRFLERDVQLELRQTLAQHGLEDLGALRDETLAALAVLGRQPARLHTATLALLPQGERSELFAYRLVDRAVADGAWTLCPKGLEVAEMLATVVPVPGPEEQETARGELQTMLDEVRNELGPLD